MSQDMKPAYRHFTRFVLLIVLVGIAFYLWKTQQHVAQGPLRIPTVVENPMSIEEISRTMQTTANSITVALEKISDHTQVQESLKAIDDSTTTVIALKLDRLPESHKSALKEEVKSIVVKMMGQLKKLYKLPGVQAIVEPAISPLLSRLQAFANVSAD